jgi:hypothetical protein
MHAYFHNAHHVYDRSVSKHNTSDSQNEANDGVCKDSMIEDKCAMQCILCIIMNYDTAQCQTCNSLPLTSKLPAPPAASFSTTNAEPHCSREGRLPFVSGREGASEVFESARLRSSSGERSACTQSKASSSQMSHQGTYIAAVCVVYRKTCMLRYERASLNCTTAEALT